MSAAKKTHYRLNTGFEYGGKRHEAGDVVNDFPPDLIKVYTEQGLIEQVDEPLTRGSH